MIPLLSRATVLSHLPPVLLLSPPFSFPLLLSSSAPLSLTILPPPPTTSF